VGFSFFPGAFDCVSVGLGIFANSIGQIVLPLTFIGGTVGPDLLAVAVFLVNDPFTFVDVAGFGASVTRTDLAKGFVTKHVAED
jgi:hypothetical protein